MPAQRPETIPAFLSVDVEPDGFQIARDDAAWWSGYDALHEFSRTLRRDLARASGATPRFGWYVRMDPQVAEVCGRPDDAVRRHPERLAALQRDGDYVGLHAHPLRWSPERRLWVHDFADRDFLRACTTSALDAFEDAMGSPVQLFRAGAAFLDDGMLDVLEERGVRIEMGFEPVSHGTPGPASVASGVDRSPVVGAFADGSSAPREAYRPDAADFRRPGGANARDIAIVPLTTGFRRLPPSAWGARLRRLVGRPARPRSVRVLYPTSAWPSDRAFWDLVAHRLATMERPYLSLGVRTDAARSPLAAKVRRLLSALPGHPLAKRLRFEHPLEALDRILPRKRAAVAEPS